jgi:hypothetical protein
VTYRPVEIELRREWLWPWTWSAFITMRNDEGLGMDMERGPYTAVTRKRATNKARRAAARETRRAAQTHTVPV